MLRVGSVGWLRPAAVLATVACGTYSVQAETFEVTLEGIWFWYDGQANMDIELFLEPGDTVRWLWIDGFHNVVSGFPGGGNEGELFYRGEPTDEPGTIFEFTFDVEPGVYGYHCHPHEDFGMISYVTVIPEPGSLVLLCAAGLLLRPHRRRRGTDAVPTRIHPQARSKRLT